MMDDRSFDRRSFEEKSFFEKLIEAVVQAVSFVRKSFTKMPSRLITKAPHFLRK